MKRKRIVELVFLLFIFAIMFYFLIKLYSGENGNGNNEALEQDHTESIQ